MTVWRLVGGLRLSTAKHRSHGQCMMYDCLTCMHATATIDTPVAFPPLRWTTWGYVLRQLLHSRSVASSRCSLSSAWCSNQLQRVVISLGEPRQARVKPWRLHYQSLRICWQRTRSAVSASVAGCCSVQYECRGNNCTCAPTRHQLRQLL